jgi:hypothetical protein
MILQHYEEHGEAFVSRTVTGDESWVFHNTPRARLNQWPGSILTLQSKTSSRQCSFQGKWLLLFSAMFRVFCWFGFTPLGSTINAAAYHETLKTLKEAIQQKDLDVDQRSSSFAQQCSTSQCCSNHKCLDLLGWEVLPQPQHRPGLHHQTSICSQRWRSTSEVSTSTPTKMSKWSQEMFMCPRCIFFLEGFDKLINWYIAIISI